MDESSPSVNPAGKFIVPGEKKFPEQLRGHEQSVGVSQIIADVDDFHTPVQEHFYSIETHPGQLCGQLFHKLRLQQQIDHCVLESMKEL